MQRNLHGFPLNWNALLILQTPPQPPHKSYSITPSLQLDFFDELSKGPPTERHTDESKMSNNCREAYS